MRRHRQSHSRITYLPAGLSPYFLPAGIILAWPRHKPNHWTRARHPTYTYPGAAMPSKRSRWNTSHRHDRLPPDWQRIRAEVKARANGRCQAKHHAKGCNGIGTDCDHIIPGDDNSLDNLQWLSSACHKAKTARETAARNTWYRKTRLHPVEKNPGSIPPGVGSTSPGTVD